MSLKNARLKISKQNKFSKLFSISAFLNFIICLKVTLFIKNFDISICCYFIVSFIFLRPYYIILEKYIYD